jgi:hypothetical protein
MFHPNIIGIPVPVQSKNTFPSLSLNTEFLSTNISLFEIHMTVLNANRIDLTIPIHGDIVLKSLFWGELWIRDSAVESPIDIWGNGSLNNTVVKFAFETGDSFEALKPG